MRNPSLDPSGARETGPTNVTPLGQQGWPEAVYSWGRNRTSVVDQDNRRESKDVAQRDIPNSLRTWTFRILTNVAKTRAVREGRSAPVSDLEAETQEGPLLDPSRFVRAGEAWEGHWQWFPGPWGEPEERLLASEARAVIATAIDALPTGQRAVVHAERRRGLDLGRDV
jgi:hypothetical protein